MVGDVRVGRIRSNAQALNLRLGVQHAVAGHYREESDVLPASAVMISNTSTTYTNEINPPLLFLSLLRFFKPANNGPATDNRQSR